MESTLPAPIDGEDDKASQPVVVGLCLGDAERITADRLDGAGAVVEEHPAIATPLALDTAASDDVPGAQPPSTNAVAPVSPRPVEDKAVQSVEDLPAPLAGAVETDAQASVSVIGELMLAHPPADADNVQPSPLVAAAPNSTGGNSSQSLTDALAAAKLSADANAEIEVATQASAVGEPVVVGHPPADANDVPHALPVAPAPTFAAGGSAQSLTGALVAAKLNAEASAEAEVPTVASAPDEPTIGHPPDEANNAVAAALATIGDDGPPSLARALNAAAELAAEPATQAPAVTEPALERSPEGTDHVRDAPAVAPISTSVAGASVQPLTSALDAAAKLAADANAAAEALENLKRLLQRQVPGVAVGLATPVPTANVEVWTAAPAEPAKPPPLPTVPLQSDQQLPVHLPLRRAPVERVRFDVRGFLAGFALSWAFGVVLYLFMTAG